jgi:hypothetical protein
MWFRKMVQQHDQETDVSILGLNNATRLDVKETYKDPLVEITIVPKQSILSAANEQNLLVANFNLLQRTCVR